MLRVATFKLESKVVKVSLFASQLPTYNQWSRKNQGFSRFIFIFKPFHGLEKIFLNSSTFQGFQGSYEPWIITIAAFLVAGDLMFELRVAMFKHKSKVAKASFLASQLPTYNQWSRQVYIYFQVLSWP